MVTSHQQGCLYRKPCLLLSSEVTSHSSKNIPISSQNNFQPKLHYLNGASLMHHLVFGAPDTLSQLQCPLDSTLITMFDRKKETSQLAFIHPLH